MVESNNPLYCRLIKIVFYSDQHDLRFILGLVEVMWAGFLLSPRTNPVSDWMPDPCLGMVFALTSLMQFYILTRCDYHSSLASAFSFWNFTLWTFLAISLYSNGFSDVATISANTGLAVGAAWLWVRSGFKNKGKRACDYGC